MTNIKHLSAVATVLLGLTVGGSAVARAGDCGAQTGKTIFEDNFKDGSGGFEDDDQAKYGASGLHLTLGKTEDSWVLVNNSFNATNGDYCVVATVPPPVSDDNLAAIGFALLYVDDDNMIGVHVFSDNTVQVEKRSKGQSDFLLNEQNPDVKASAGSTIAIRAVLQNGSLTIYVNGVAFKSVHIDLPDGANKFGTYVGLDKVANKETPFDFKSIRITDSAK